MTSVPTVTHSSKTVDPILATIFGSPRPGRHRRRRAVTRVAVLAAMLPLVAVPTAAAATVEPAPAPTTVLTLSPFSTDSVMASQLQGSLCRAPNNCVPVNWTPRLYVPAGVTALDSAVSAQSDGPYIVFGYSQGAEVVEQWLKQHADDPAAPDPADVKFVLIGNPTRPYGGTGSFFGEVLPQTDYQVVDVSREYDFVSDFPNKPLSPFYVLAVANAAAGLATVHLNYTDVSVDDPANTTWQEGNTTYILVPTQNLPLLAPLQAMGVNTTALNAVLKPMVDSAYDRTYGGRVTPQPVTATAAPSTQLKTVEPVVTTGAAAATASSGRASAVVDHVARPDQADAPVARTADAPDSDPAVTDADTTGPTTRITGGNKFEPNPTGANTTTSVGGQRHSGPKPIGSALGKIVKGIKKALTHD